MYFVRAILIWLCILALAIANGAIRESLISPRTGPALGHILSTILLGALIVAAAWLAIPWIGPATRERAWAVGVLWVVLTLAFEFLAGHYLFRDSWHELLADYNLFQGRIWILVPLVTLLAPVWAHSVRVP